MNLKYLSFLVLLPLFSVVFFSCSSLPPQGVSAEEFGMYQVAAASEPQQQIRTLEDSELPESNHDAVKALSVSNATFVYHDISMEEFVELCIAVGHAGSEYKNEILSQVLSREVSSGVSFAALPSDEDFKPNYDEEKSLGCQQLYLTVGADALGVSDLSPYLNDLNLPVDLLPRIFFAANEMQESNDPFSLKGYYLKLEYQGQNRNIHRSSYGSIQIAIKLDARTPITVGGFESMTNGTGNFYFSGEPSLSRIVEGIVLIIDEDGNRIEARESPENGNWYARVSGQKDNAPYEFDFDIEALNY